MSESELERSRRVNARPSTKKPLSDEEIVNIWEKANYESKYYEASDNFAIEFARAILKKASEK